MFKIFRTLLIPEPKPERLQNLLERELETERYAKMKKRIFAQEADMQLTHSLTHLRRDGGPAAHSR